MPQPSKDRYAHDALAFLIVECNVPLPFEVAESMTTEDPLYISLVGAFNRRKEREDFRTALLCMVINNSAGGKSKIDDFMPKKKKTATEREEEIRQNIINYNLTQKGTKT